MNVSDLKRKRIARAKQQISEIESGITNVEGGNELIYRYYNELYPGVKEYFEKKGFKVEVIRNIGEWDAASNTYLFKLKKDVSLNDIIGDEKGK